MKKDELLAVLDMTEDEQWTWCVLEHVKHAGESLADLAFRKRGEVVKKYSQGWQSAKRKVAEYIWGGYSDLGWDEEATPIMWIVAAQKAKDTKDVHTKKTR